MFWRASAIKGFEIDASDGHIGAVADLLFDDKTWMTKWLVVHTGPWLVGRKVLLPVASLGKPDRDARQVRVQLTRQQVKDSPAPGTDLPVSQYMGADVYSYDEHHPFWQGGSSPRGLLGEGTAVFMPRVGLDADPLYQGGAEALAEPGDISLRSVSDVTGYHMAATDGTVGHIEDFLVDEADWRIRYLVVDTRNWLPGLRVVISPRSIREISWAKRSIYLDADRAAIKASPPYDPYEIEAEAFNTRFDEHFNSRPQSPAAAPNAETG
jgi:hypothetical protein